MSSEAGRAVHVAKSGRLIIKVGDNTKLVPGETLIDESGKRVGKVTEIIGPVMAPYASILLLDNHTGVPGGGKLYRYSSHRSESSKFKSRSRTRSRSLRKR